MAIAQAAHEHIAPSPSADTTRVLAVIVLYKMDIAESVSVCSLQAACEQSALDVHIAVFDNSAPPGAEQVELSPRTTYYPLPRNLGLANAYNRAIEFAEREGYGWLLTLDQDTDLPLHFIQKLEAALLVAESRLEIATIAPQVVAEGRVVSPYDLHWEALSRWFPKGYVGVPTRRTLGFNSSATHRVTALRQAGGYAPYFWLDCSDLNMFDTLYRYGKRVYVAGDLQVEHEFSMMAMADRISPWKYRHMLLGEAAFWDARMNVLARWERMSRLVLRLGKHIRRGDSATLQAMTRRSLFDRLFHSESYRRQMFEQQVEQDMGCDPVQTALAARSVKVSVCMATYNGSRWIDAQMHSILNQLRPWDEVVVVDDCSNDDTLKRMEALNDPRIRIMRHAHNKHVMGTFEDALRAATGDILFLSDQDDIWASNKVERMLAVFAADPTVSIVTSKVGVIDEAGQRIPGGHYGRGGRFFAGFWKNVWKNHYQGSAMAIRASLLGSVMPFPPRSLFVHDVWLGTRSDASGGKTVFLEEELLLYRRHSENDSNHRTRLNQLHLRLQLLAAHMRYALRF